MTQEAAELHAPIARGASNREPTTVGGSQGVCAQGQVMTLSARALVAEVRSAAKVGAVSGVEHRSLHNLAACRRIVAPLVRSVRTDGRWADAGAHRSSGYVGSVAMMRLGAVSFDCADPATLAAFWAELLGGEIVLARDDIGVVKLEHLLLTAMRVDDYAAPSWPGGPVPKQGHLDLAVDDLAEAERRAVALGAVRAGSQPVPTCHTVLFDPAGHPFCLSRATNFPE
jgi:hypothetical protein